MENGNRDRRIIRFCFDRKGRQIIAVLHTKKHVHLYRESTRKMIYNFPEHVVDICFDASLEGVNLLCLMSSGHVFACPLPEFKKKKSGRKAVNEQDETSTVRTKMHQLHFQSTSEAVIMVNANHMLATIPGATSILCVMNWIITSAKTDTGFKISLYNKSTISSEEQPYASLLVPSTQLASRHYKPLLVCTLHEGSHDSISQSSSVLLEPSLHQRLFNTSEPVVLFSSGNGCIYYIPLPSQTSCFIESLQLHILYNSAQCIIDVHSAVIKKQTDESSSGQESPALLLVSTTGQVMAITRQSESNLLVYNQLCIPAPVISSCTSGNRLYHASDRELFSTELMVATNKTDQIVPESLRHAKVSSLIMLKCRSQDSSPSLFTVLTSGEDRVISPEKQQQIVHVAGCDRMKDLLTSIHTVHQELETASKQSQYLNDILSQLNLASHIVSCDKSEKCPVKFESSVKLKDMGATFEFVLECLITNSTTITMSSGWSVSMVLEYGCHGDMAVLSKSQSLTELQPNQSQLICHPMTPDMIRKLPIKVKPVLLYSFHGMTEDGVSVTAPLLTQTIDFIDVLRPSTNTNQCQKLHQSDVDTFNMVNDITKQRRVAMGTTEEERSEGPVTTSLVVPRMPVSKKRKADEASSLLQTILQGTQLAPSSSDQDFVRALTPCGHQVSLSTNNTDEQTDVVMHAPTSVLLWKLMTSFEGRLQRISSKSKKAVVIAKELRQYLTHIEEVRSEVERIGQDVRDTDMAGLFWQLRNRTLP